MCLKMYPSKRGTHSGGSSFQTRSKPISFGGLQMKIHMKGVAAAPRVDMEYALPKSGRPEPGEPPDTGRERERIREMLLPLVKEAVQKQLREQQDYYRSRPSLAAKQLEQVFGAGNLEKALAPAVSLRVYERIEERIRQERIRKGR